MADEHNNDESKKTLVAFVVGLLIGGMLVWAFSGPSDEKKLDDANTDEMTASTTDAVVENVEEAATAPTLKVAEEGVIVVNDQPAAATVAIESATYPVGEGWIGVRQYTDEKLGYILGVVRFSESQGLVPEDIILQTPTKAGSTYAVVVFREDGDFDFNLAGDVQIDQIYTTFTAQ
jgi:hypothetical protein